MSRPAGASTQSVLLDLARRTVAACEAVYGSRFVAMGVFGSVGRSVARPDSDIDLLIVIDPLPDGRLIRMAEWADVEGRMAAEVSAAKSAGIDTTLSPVLRTPAELSAGSPLMFDMVDDLVILKDRQEILAGAVDGVRRRLARLGSKRVWRGNAWYWDLKPDYRVGEVFDL